MSQSLSCMFYYCKVWRVEEQSTRCLCQIYLRKTFHINRSRQLVDFQNDYFGYLLSISRKCSGSPAKLIRFTVLQVSVFVQLCNLSLSTGGHARHFIITNAICFTSEKIIKVWWHKYHKSFSTSIKFTSINYLIKY